MKKIKTRIHCFAEPITVAEIKAVISENKIKPSDLFDMSTLVGDPVVIGFVADEKKTASVGEFAHRKRLEEKYEKERGEWDKEKKELTDANVGLVKENAKSAVGKLFDTAKEKRKLDEVQTKYIEARIPKFDLDDPEKIETEFDKFLDDQVDAYKKDADVFGVKIEDGGDDADTPKGGEPSKQTDGVGDDELYTKPL